jgi:hypothetical protein
LSAIDTLSWRSCPVNPVNPVKKTGRLQHELQENTDAVDRIRRMTNTASPCGTVASLARLETLLGRTLRPQKRDRKHKTLQTPSRRSHATRRRGGKETANPTTPVLVRP